MGAVRTKVEAEQGRRGAVGRRSSAAFCRQRGAYALEFALVFVVFLTLVLGLIAAGVTFASQQLLTLAAEDGARASLRYHTDLAERSREACVVAERRAQALGGICVDDGVARVGVCNAPAVTTNCQYIRVVVMADSLLPLLPGVPRRLTGVAMVRLDPAVL